MKTITTIIICLILSAQAMAQTTTKANVSQADPAKKIQIVEAACGECRLGMKGKSCDLAIRINGKSYFVDGTDIDSHGDAHAKNGFCEAIRKAEVQGEIVNDRFKATYFKLLPEDKKKVAVN